MTPGRVIAVVGPSGVGKDSVMAGLAQAMPRFEIVRRVITRPPELGGEEYDAVDDEQFAHQVADGAFCLHWQAHELSYGIPVQVADRAARGQSFLVNLSRNVLLQADEVFDDFVILHLTARPATLAGRLAGRGRESEADIAARLARSAAAIPPQLSAVTISNDGALAQTVAAAKAALQPVRA